MLIFGCYAGILPWLTARHEVWRDEVRAYSIAQSATNPIDLICNKLADEGHPGLWHLLLWIGSCIFNSPAVVKIASYLIAVAFSAILFFRSPFPLLHRTLFLIGIFPIYTYSVNSRNYGISALCLFLLALEYARRENFSPWRAGIYNALLANTNVFGTMCAIAFLLVPPYWITPLSRRIRAWGLGTALSAFGILLAAYTVWPSANNQAMQALDEPDRRPQSAVADRSPSAILRGMAVIAVDREAWSSFILTGERWKYVLNQSVGEVGAIAIGFAGLVLLCLPLLRPPWLLAAFAAALLATGLFSRHVHLAADRHLGVLAAFYLALLWIARAWATDGKSFAWRVGLGLLAVCLLAHARAGVVQTYRSFQTPISQSRNAGAFLAEFYPDSIVLCEPDYYAESLVYYAPNRFYFVRENCFGSYVHFMRPFNRDLSLRELMDAANRLRGETGQSILVSTRVPIAELRDKTAKEPERRNLIMTEDDLVEFQAHYTEVGRFLEGGAERYVFYLLQN
jgi:hypothetical protein